MSNSMPGRRISIKATEDVAKNKFAKYNGKKCGAGELAAGITDDGYTNGETMALIAGGSALIKLGADVSTIGTPLAADANGYAVAATTGNFVNGIAVETGTSGQVIEVELCKYKI